MPVLVLVHAPFGLLRPACVLCAALQADVVEEVARAPHVLDLDVTQGFGGPTIGTTTASTESVAAREPVG